MAVKKIEHVGVMVKDIDTSIEFYTKIIGLELLGKLDHPDPKIKLVFLAFKNAKETQLELIQGYNDDLPVEGKVHHLAFNVDDIEAEVERLKELNVSFIDQGITTLANGSRYIFFAGPDGERIEFFQTETKS